MNANCASDAKVSLALGFKNTRKEDSDLKSATPKLFWMSGYHQMKLVMGVDAKTGSSVCVMQWRGVIKDKTLT
jgi:hypothetical protein